jgi:hypothetical protein
MFSPFEPVTTQTGPPSSTSKNAVSPMRSPRRGAGRARRRCRRPGRHSIGDPPYPAPPGAGPRRSNWSVYFHSSSGSRPYPGRDESGIADPLDYCVPVSPDRRYPTPSPAATFPAISRPPRPGRAPAATPRSPSSPRPRPPGLTPKPSPSPALDRPRVGEDPTFGVQVTPIRSTAR